MLAPGPAPRALEHDSRRLAVPSLRPGIWSAALGGAAWLVLAAGHASGLFEVPVGTIALLFSLAPLVAVPLGLELCARPEDRARSGLLLPAARLLQPPAAALAVISFFLPAHPWGWLAAAWTAFTVLLGLWGLGRLVAGRPFSGADLCSIAALLYLPIGGAGLLVSRLGLNPLGFEEPLLLLFAVHYHFSAFAAPVLAGALGRRLEGAAAAPGPAGALGPRLEGAAGPRRVLFRLAAAGVVAGPALIASGYILSSPLLRLISVLLLCLSLWGLAAVQGLLIPGVRGRLARALLAVSTASVIAGMGFAAVYGWGDFRGRILIDIPRMAVTHGVLNGVGFTVAGLAGWLLAGPGKEGAR